MTQGVLENNILGHLESYPETRKHKFLNNFEKIDEIHWKIVSFINLIHRNRAKKYHNAILQYNIMVLFGGVTVQKGSFLKPTSLMGKKKI